MEIAERVNAEGRERVVSIGEGTDREMRMDGGVVGEGTDVVMEWDVWGEG